MECVTYGQAAWEPRSCMPTVVHQGKMVMMGGCQGYTRFNDVWASSDGVAWTLLTADAGWSKRCCFPAVVYDGGIVVSGGHDEDDYRNDVWRSNDGVRWTEFTPAAPWGSRDGHAAVLLASSIIIIGIYHHPNQAQETPSCMWQAWWARPSTL